MARIATIPMNPTATKEANDEFYKNHPEMIKDGKRIPIDSCNPMHAKYQKEWMDSYVKHGGKVRIGKEQKQCGNPVQSCPCDGILVVTVVESIETKEPVPLAYVEIDGPKYDKAQTDDKGQATFSGLEEGLYWIDVHSSDDKQLSQGTAQVNCRQISEVLLSFDEMLTLVVDVIDQFKEHVSNVPVYAARGSVKAAEKRTDEQGQAIFEDLPAGDYQISAGVLKKSRDIHYENSKTVSITEGRTNLVLNVIATCEVPLVWVDDSDITDRVIYDDAFPEANTQITTQYHTITLEQKTFVPTDYYLVDFEEETLDGPHVERDSQGTTTNTTEKKRYKAKYESHEGGIVSGVKKFFTDLPIEVMDLTPDEDGFRTIIKSQQHVTKIWDPASINVTMK